MATADRSSAQRIPAWKKLGLKLKQPGAAAADGAVGGGSVGQPSSSAGDGREQRTGGLKRKPDTSNKQQATESPSKKRKSVSFGDTPTKQSLGITPAKPAKQSNSKAKGPSKKQQVVPVAADLQPALEYLRQWRTAREGWKFNKNHQTTLIKYAFEPQLIPATNIGAFYEYIRELKGGVRTRLCETAMEIRTKDHADKAEGFPKGTKDLEATQQKYETILTGLLHKQAPSTKKRSFDEQEFVEGSDDTQLILQRIIKRMRAEMVLDELSDDSDASTSTVSTTKSEGTNADGPEPPKRARLNDGTSKRKRKLRTANVDDTSSSESESDSDSDSDTSSSGEEEEEEDGADETSSSSSSSSDESSELESEES